MKKKHNKKKQQIVTSDLSDNNSVDGMTTHTTPHPPTHTPRALLPGVGPN